MPDPLATVDDLDPLGGYVILRDVSGRRLDTKRRPMETAGTSGLALGNSLKFARGVWSGRAVTPLGES